MGQIAHLWITVALGFPFRTPSMSLTGINGSSTSRTNRQSFHTERRISPTWCVSITQTHLAPREGNNHCEPPHPCLSIPSSLLCCLWPPAPGRQSDIFNSFYLFITPAPSCFTFPCTFLQWCWVHSKDNPSVLKCQKQSSTLWYFGLLKTPSWGEGYSENAVRPRWIEMSLPLVRSCVLELNKEPALSTSQNQIGMRRQKWAALPRWNHLQGFWSPWKYWKWAVHKDLATVVSFPPSFWRKMYGLGLSISPSLIFFFF